MVKVENLTKVYGKNIALDGVSFSVKKGQITGFLGPNGAGKTTTMNIMCGYIATSQGRVFINGGDLRDDPIKTKKSIGYLPERPPLYTDMLVSEYLGFVLALKGVKRDQIKTERDRLSNSLGLQDVQDRLIGNLSQGYRQRMGLAQALCGSPELLVLDEPTVGLDPRQIIEFRSLILSLKSRHTILISSHILSEIESFCDYLVVINHGRVVAEGTKEQLMKTVQEQGKRILVRVRGSVEIVSDILKSVTGVNKIDICSCEEMGASEFLVYSDLDCDLREVVFYTLAKNSLPLLLMTSKTINLEDVFLSLTQ